MPDAANARHQTKTTWKILILILFWGEYIETAFGVYAFYFGCAIQVQPRSGKLNVLNSCKPSGLKLGCTWVYNVQQHGRGETFCFVICRPAKPMLGIFCSGGVLSATVSARLVNNRKGGSIQAPRVYIPGNPRFFPQKVNDANDLWVNQPLCANAKRFPCRFVYKFANVKIFAVVYRMLCHAANLRILQQKAHRNFFQRAWPINSKKTNWKYLWIGQESNPHPELNGTRSTIELPTHFFLKGRATTFSHMPPGSSFSQLPRLFRTA